jgi:hypothetical protein
MREGKEHEVRRRYVKKIAENKFHGFDREGISFFETAAREFENFERISVCDVRAHVRAHVAAQPWCVKLHLSLVSHSLSLPLSTPQTPIRVRKIQTFSPLPLFIPVCTIPIN